MAQQTLRVQAMLLIQEGTGSKIVSQQILVNRNHMKTYTIYNAKTHLSRLIEEACAGKEIVIARGKTPLVKLVRLDQPIQQRRFGAMRGKATVSNAFFEPLPEDELREWEP
ncbi:MAG: type II toxin-antitoxin system Phd/YefM family antitoxin [Methylococcales bacterium]